MSETFLDGPVGVGVFTGPVQPAMQSRRRVQLTIRSGADLETLSPAQCRELIEALRKAYLACTANPQPSPRDPRLQRARAAVSAAAGATVPAAAASFLAGAIVEICDVLEHGA